MSDELDNLQDEEGFYDLVGAYWLLLALEYVKPDEGVILDLTEFEFEEEDILAEIKKVFIGKVSTYNFLFRNTLSGADQSFN